MGSFVNENGVSPTGSTPWIQTYSGKAFDLVFPTPEMVDIEDIAWSLSRINRYNGHTTRRYSVAQHCVAMSRKAMADGHSVEIALAMLLHDASEAYLGDMTRPVQLLLESLMPGFRATWTDAHNHVSCVILERFGFTGLIDLHDPLVKQYDNAILLDEKAQVMAPEQRDWGLTWDGLGVALYREPDGQHGLGYTDLRKSYVAQFNHLAAQVRLKARDLLEVAFGDHAEIVVTRDALTVNSADHD
jgi:hypothetical protein